MTLPPGYQTPLHDQYQTTQCDPAAGLPYLITWPNTLLSTSLPPHCPTRPYLIADRAPHSSVRPCRLATPLCAGLIRKNDKHPMMKMPVKSAHPEKLHAMHDVNACETGLRLYCESVNSCCQIACEIISVWCIIQCNTVALLSVTSLCETCMQRNLIFIKLLMIVCTPVEIITATAQRHSRL